MELIKLEKMSIKNHKDIDEYYIQKIIAEDPKLLNLGDLILKDKERIQPNAGRLDLLLEDEETRRRYEVEIQLGKTDESHIVRTLEYWDIERKRYPQYDHCAVIIAEDVTSRFLNVISLFNGNIPIIALQMNAYKIEDNFTIVFTKVLDEIKLGFEEDEGISENADRNYWENKGSIETVKIADELLKIIKEKDEDFEITYKKPYIGLAKKNRAQNFITFNAKKKNLRMEIKLEKDDEIDDLLEQSDLDVMEYNIRNNRYRIRLEKEDIDNNLDLLKLLIDKSYLAWNL